MKLPTRFDLFGKFRQNTLAENKLLADAGDAAIAASPSPFALFIAPAKTLTVIGSSLADDAVTASRNAAGMIVLNGGAVPVVGGTPSVANTTLIQMFGQGGNDKLTIDESSGAMPRAFMFGGSGNDAISAGSGSDQLFGQSGNDTMLGKGGFDAMFGGDGNDTLVGGDADDQLFGEGGDDRFVWNQGDDTDLNEGGAGNDTTEVNGGGGAEVFTAAANGARVRFDRLDPAPFSIDIGTVENLVVVMNGGNDNFSAAGDLAALVKITVDGGADNDTILGSNGNDLLLGGDGDDFIDGERGDDTSLLGAGNDAFRWDAGDGSDTVDGGTGFDTLRFGGSGADELFEASAAGGRLRLTRDVGSIAMDLNEVEKIELNAFGGSDTIVAGDLSGTGAQELRIDLALVPGASTGDGEADTVIANGTAGDDFVTLLPFGGVAMLGLPAFTTIAGADGALDSLVVNGGDGRDRIEASSLPAGALELTIDAGAGDDNITGSDGDDTLLAGDGDDFVGGDRGNDTALLGAGDDIFRWQPGDGSDTIEGQAGRDALVVSGSSANEAIGIGAVGSRVRLSRDIDNAALDFDGVESLSFFSFGGADSIVIDDLAGTDVERMDISLFDFAVPGGAVDRVVINASAGDDDIDITASNGVLLIEGLAAQIRITGFEVNDLLVVNGLGGDDSIDATGVGAGTLRIQADGGDGNDVLQGGAGDDVLLGGDGADVVFAGEGDNVALGGAGDDVLRGESGDDVLDGGAGDDILIGGAGDDVLLNGEVVFDELVAAPPALLDGLLL